VPLTTAASLPSPPRPRPRPALPPLVEGAALRIVPWVDPVADPLGVHPCSRYVELYWLGVIGPSTTWLLRRLAYGLEVNREGFELDLCETARSLGLGERLGKNSPFRKALHRLCTFELARGQGPGALAVRTVVPPLPLRHLSRLPESLQVSHRRWAAEQRLSGPDQMQRRARRLAEGLATRGQTREQIERQLGAWHFHPAVAYSTASTVVPDETAAPGGTVPTDGTGTATAPERHGMAFSPDRPRGPQS
jgi:hypothetical protein